MQNTLSKPWTGGTYKAGKAGGIWYDTILSDPKTFNQLIAQRDGTSAGIVSMTLDGLVDYDPTLREWTPRVASYKIETDETANTLTVHYTIRDDYYWTWPDSDKKVPVTGILQKLAQEQRGLRRGGPSQTVSYVQGILDSLKVFAAYRIPIIEDEAPRGQRYLADSRKGLRNPRRATIWAK